MPDNTMSVTDIEGYRYYKNSEWQTFDKYLSQLLRLEPPTDAMEWGTKWHKYLQDMAMGKDVSGKPEVYGEYEWQVEPELDQPDVVEMPVEKTYNVRGREILVRGRVDAVVGNTVIDYKTTKKLDVDLYMDSYQWRAYLDMVPESNMFRYDVFVMSEPLKKKVVVEGKTITTKDLYRVIRDYHYLELSKYPELHNDVAHMIAEYDEFLLGLHGQGKINLSPEGNGVIRKRSFQGG